MRLSVEQYRNWENKRITLLGMSGVGKTYISSMLRNHNWFHYSGDYRIGTRYLDEDILDLIKEQAMKVPFLRELLRNDWIYIRNNIRVNDLGPVLSFVGKLGNPELGGVALDDFMRRQAMYREAEIAAMHDVPEFIRKAQLIYGYSHFVNDAGGSLCELEDPAVFDTLAENTLILYIKVTTKEEEQKLIDRARSDPKPLYYRPNFLKEHLAVYLQEKALQYAAEMEPDEFTRWVFPRLFHSRLPRYEAIARDYGYTVTSEEAAQVRNEDDFNALIEMAIARHA
ncbi:MAG TPA: ATPase [Candidatus Thiothrix moscowensis]|uniref:ATPase n=1 Tax=unclassified Thiothrix TaxID=2636184 RepID=UPI001A255C73|nr:MULTISPECIES: ATPase [unclassified Thiothrix]MBJ6610859.1 ATPase [Candidatus Thiothrix moscowensis]HRJ52501.1 ATPase [Candidatus Thiothrix moscowensis]HRJ93313.1 ATPase [Candidatus Thiothrix moscowensis]